ncbi:DUF922 domain-containing Zn-dependent protease [Hymenobacter sp. BT635]|uniref:DUF922 domain-containing Zn-dependent protease n=1 Tax=Hymenobacter nitidus TaxID=2880929 RepID=A0ABS8AAK3_9BACT|nr:DUF922 domain-containing protein [Hymenobacter nitidus]MCB2377428.1 DUF922 domain-containing Zn-dependent protease [Hymenobacter nitidus]
MLPVLLLQGPQPATPKPAPALIGWSANRPLTWADFQAKPQPTEQLAALTAANIDVQVGCKDYVFSSEVKAVFIPTESWVRDKGKASPELLRHEQLHFDITELHARMLRQKISLIKLDCEHLNPAFKNLTTASFAAWKREEFNYDRESNHGLNTVKQTYWEAQVKQRLALLEKFASQP